MTALAFDTLAYARRMEAVGFSREQAEAMAEEQAKVIDDRLATKTDMEIIRQGIEGLRLATRPDIEALRLATKSDIEGLRAELKADLAETKAEIFKVMLGQTFVIIGAIAALLKLIGH